MTVDVLVVGGGLSGSLAALELARAGRQVTLLEKSKGAHHKVCGEFLSADSLRYLARHGIDPVALGGVPIRCVRLLGSGWGKEAALPFAAVSLTRRRLDQELLRLAVQAGVDVRRDAGVASLDHQAATGQTGGLWWAHLQDGASVEARQVMLATGKHDLRGWPRTPGRQNGLVAFKMYFRLTEQQKRGLVEAVELVLFPGGYAGLQPVEDGAANLCLLIEATELKAAGGNWPGVLERILTASPHLRGRLDGAEPLLEKPLAASRIPYGYLQPGPRGQAAGSLWRLGDQAAVIPSFCGDGMAIALHSGALAASCLLAGRSPEQYRQQLHGQLAGRVLAATRLSQLLVNLPWAAQLARFAPGLLPAVASMTRIPASVFPPLVRSGR